MFRIRAGFLITAAALLAWPLAARAQQTTPDPKVAADTVEKKGTKDETIVLSPFTVTTDKDRGYAATNAISGSRVDAAIKEPAVPMQVITSEFIRDTGATDLRKSLSYVAGISLQSQMTEHQLAARIAELFSVISATGATMPAT